MVQPGLSAESATQLPLAPGVYNHVQDAANGVVRTNVGSSIAMAQPGQEQPVRYSHDDRMFTECSLYDSVCRMPVAEEGDYLVLENPAEGNAHPNANSNKQDCPGLLMGSKINVPGPCQFALWPGQHATLVAGHNLRSNQHLLVRVYNEQAAKENWRQATIRKVEPTPHDSETEQPAGTDEAAAPPEMPDAEAEDVTFSAGQRIIIRGDQVSFFIPPTGMEVVAERRDDGRTSYVREAVTLERLEYCILVDEDGNKRYEKGPQVVFPQPTEIFLEHGGARKFRAYELNPIQGLHVKVIADYSEGGVDYSEGQELFITGRDTPIYFPRPEHSIIMYGERDKHFAVAIPPGEGRYVMNRLTGEIKTMPGYDMLLCDPREEVIVQRVLTQKQVELWYPESTQAAQYNRDLAAEAASNKTSSLGYVERSVPDAAMAFGATVQEPTASLGAMRRLAAAEAPRRREKAKSAHMPDEFARGTSFTPPRTLTLDSAKGGVPPICPWTGYAIRVVNKSGSRRTVEGPDAILLDFDEDLEVLTLSSGRPKGSNAHKKTVYLRVKNNKVSDIVQNVVTADHVPLDLTLSFNVDFEGNNEKWFDVENPVKLLTDHVRSVLKGRIRKLGVEDFWSAGADFIRDFVLGPVPESGDRPGMVFKQNGMRITDVEILDIEIKNAQIAQMLVDAESEVVATNIRLEKAERDLKALQRTEEISRDTKRARHETAELGSKLEQAVTEMNRLTRLAEHAAAFEIAEAKEKTEIASEKVNDVMAQAELQRSKWESDEELRVQHVRHEEKVALLRAEAETVVQRFSGLSPQFVEALLTVSNQDTMTKMAQAGSVQNMLGGGNLVEVLGQILSGGNGDLPKPFQRVLESIGAGISGGGEAD